MKQPSRSFFHYLAGSVLIAVLVHLVRRWWSGT